MDKMTWTWKQFCSHPQISLPVHMQQNKRTNNSLLPYELQSWLNPMSDRIEEYFENKVNIVLPIQRKKSLTNSSFFLNPVKHSTKFNMLAQYSGRQEKGKG